MNPEVEFVLDALDSVVGAQPSAHPLRRVDRENSLVYETGGTVDMTDAIHKRTDALRKANYVGVALQSGDNTPIGTSYDHERDLVLSVRVEGMRGFGDLFGHIDPDGNEGVVFDQLYQDIRGALLDERSFPSHPSFRDDKTDLRVTNEDYQSSDWADFYRREFDLVLKSYEDL